MKTTVSIPLTSFGLFAILFYYAMTTHDWNWWVNAGLVISFCCSLTPIVKKEKNNDTIQR